MEILICIFVSTIIIYIVTKISAPSIVMKNPKYGVPRSRMIYSDETGGKLLVSEKYELQGKPDYIFQSIINKKYIPVEIKSTQLKDDETYPHEGDLMQLVAYFLIIEDVYGSRPKYGRLVYKNRMFIIKNTRALRKQLKRSLREMRQMLVTGVGQAEPSFPKCRNCVSRGTVCKWYDKE